MSFQAMFALVGWAKTASRVLRWTRFICKWYREAVPKATDVISDAQRMASIRLRASDDRVRQGGKASDKGFGLRLNAGSSICMIQGRTDPRLSLMPVMATRWASVSQKLL